MSVTQYRNARNEIRAKTKANVPKGPLEYTVGVLSRTSEEDYFNSLDYKAASFVDSREEVETGYAQKRKNAVWDPNLSRYRCAPGTRYGGRITNRVGAGCGGNIIRRALRGVGRAAGAVANVIDVSNPRTGVDTKPGRDRGGSPNVPGGRVGDLANRRPRIVRRRENVPEGAQRERRAEGEDLSPDEVEYARNLNAFGRALARLAEGVDVEETDTQVEDLETRTGINPDELTPERRGVLAEWGQAINRGLNRFADQVDVENRDREDRDVADLPDRTDGNLPDSRAGRIRGLAREADANAQVQQRRAQRERRGIARRERQIGRRQRLEDLAARIDPDAEENIPHSLGGRIRNPVRREARGSVAQIIDAWNDRQKGRVVEAARGAYQDLDSWWAERLGRNDFTFNDIRRFVDRLEGRDDIGEDALRLYRDNRDDWGELRPFFDPFLGDGEDVNTDEILDAVGRLSNDRWAGIVDRDADINRTLRGLNDADAQNLREIRAIDQIYGEERRRVDALTEHLRRGDFNRRHRSEWDRRKQQMTSDVRRAERDREKALKKVSELEKQDGADPVEIAKQRAIAQQAAHKRGTIQRILDSMDRREQRHRDAYELRGRGGKPAAVKDYEAEGAKVRRLVDTPGEAVLYNGNDNTPDNIGGMGQVLDNGLPRAERISNPNIKTEQDAIDHVKNGGDLAEVPNDLWYVAVDGNSSTDEVSRKRYQKIVPGNGAIGETVIFKLRDDKGNPTHKGFVFKAQDDGGNADEKVMFGLYELAGLKGPVFGMDGVSTGNNRRKGRRGGAGARFAVIPFGGNFGDITGEVDEGRRPFDLRLYEDVPDAGLDGRFINALHNFVGNVSDRHSGNAYNFKVGNKVITVPIDFGGFRRRDGVDFERYVSGEFGMDLNLFDGTKGHLERLDDDEAVKQARQLVDTIDGYIANMGRIKDISENDFVEAMTADLENPSRKTLEQVRNMHGQITRNVERLENDRNRIVGRIIPQRVIDRMAEVEAPPPAIPEVQKVGNRLIPDNEVDINPDFADVGAAVAHIKNGGAIAEIPDHALFDAMLGSSDLKLTHGGGNINVKDFENLVDQNDIGKGFAFHNDRFAFKAIKVSRQGNGVPWLTLEVTDRDTDRKYYLKANVYSAPGDGAGELVGADLARLVGFPQDDENGAVRVGPRKGNSGWRWVMIPHVADYRTENSRRESWKDVNQLMKEQGVDLARGGHLSGIELNPQDAARIMVMDYLGNNQDRHVENVLLVGDPLDKRIAPIDHGLLGFGRKDGTLEFPNGEPFLSKTPAGVANIADLYGDLTPAEYAWGKIDTGDFKKMYEAGRPFRGMYNNIYRSLLRYKGSELINKRKREEVQQHIEEIIDEIKDIDADEFFDPVRLGRKGIEWTDMELAHFDAMKKMFVARRKRLIENRRGLIEALDKPSRVR